MALYHRVMATDEVLSKLNIRLAEDAALVRFSGGDARKFLNIIELVVNSQEGADEIVIDDKKVVDLLQQTSATYDKKGEMHYDIISAFIKSIRGSDPDAAVYWLARMIEEARILSLSLVG